jgi:hypothetical protein
MKKYSFAFILICISCAVVFATPLQSGTYICNGTDFKMSLTPIAKSGLATLYQGNNIVSNATLSLTDTTIAITFLTGSAQYKGKTWVYIIDSDTSFSGNGELWLKINTNFMAPQSGGITNPAATGAEQIYTLKPGTYSLSGSRRQMVIFVSGHSGSGHIKDDSGKPAGNFNARIDGNHLAIIMISGNDTGITYDYQITSNSMFSRHREDWIWRYGY